MPQKTKYGLKDRFLMFFLCNRYVPYGLVLFSIVMIEFVNSFDFNMNTNYIYVLYALAVPLLGYVVYYLFPFRKLKDLKKGTIDKRQRYMVIFMLVVSLMDLGMTFINYSLAKSGFSSFELNKILVVLTALFGSFGFFIMFVITLLFILSMSTLGKWAEERYRKKSSIWKALPIGNAIGFASNVVGFFLIMRGIL